MATLFTVAIFRITIILNNSIDYVTQQLKRGITITCYNY